MMADSGASKLLTVAMLSASASAALTYACMRVKSQRSKQKSTKARPVSDHSSCCDRAPAKRDPYDASPRTGYLSWDDYFMAVAFLSAQRSKDPNKQVGACIVDQNQVICGIGYNGFPRGCPDSHLPWAKKSRGGDPLQTKYPYVCHAEMNAILNKNGASVAGAKIYVTLFPCNECAKLLIQAGIREIIYHEDKLAPERAPSPSKDGFRPDQQYAASKHLLALAGVHLRQHRFQHPVTLRLTNHPAYPVVRSVDSAIVAAESAAAAARAAAVAAAAGAEPASIAAGGTGTSAAPSQPCCGDAAAATIGSAAAAAAVAATAAVLGGLGFGLAPAGTAGKPPAVGGASPLLAAVARYQWQWETSGQAAAAAAASNGATSGVDACSACQSAASSASPSPAKGPPGFDGAGVTAPAVSSVSSGAGQAAAAREQQQQHWEEEEASVDQQEEGPGQEAHVQGMVDVEGGSEQAEEEDFEESSSSSAELAGGSGVWVPTSENVGLA